MFKDREEGGILLAEKLKTKDIPKDAIIFAIPRGGVVTAKVVSNKLGLKMSAVVIKKIGEPGNPELAIGAVGPGNVVFWENEIIESLGLEKEEIENAKREKAKEREKKEKILGVKMPDIQDKTVIIVDDGVATGATAVAASMSLKKLGAGKIILAIPVIARESLERIKSHFNDVVYINAPSAFFAVGEFYQNFPQVSDKEASDFLH